VVTGVKSLRKLHPHAQQSIPAIDTAIAALIVVVLVLA
jgi:hypothetical protein